MMEPVLANGEIDLEGSEAVLNGADTEAQAILGVNGAEITPVDGRVKRLKAKRLLKQLSKETVVANGTGGSLVTAPRRWKNTRRPRNGYGRGLAKKGKRKDTKSYQGQIGYARNACQDRVTRSSCGVYKGTSGRRIWSKTHHPKHKQITRSFHNV